MSTPFSRRCVAKLCRNVWQCAPFKSARFAADDTIFWMFLVERLPFRPVNKYFLFFCFFVWCCRSSIRNSGMLKILSLFPLACLMCPIFSGKFRSEIFRFVNSETRNPQAYIRLIISFDFSFLISLMSFLISSFERIIGSLISFFGRLIVDVMSLCKIEECAYLIAARKSVIDVAALLTKFSAMNNLTSSVVIWLGCFFVKLIRS